MKKVKLVPYITLYSPCELCTGDESEKGKLQKLSFRSRTD